jgi:serine phosphatase RsbU (regulator of sigma subunit)
VTTPTRLLLAILALLAILLGVALLGVPVVSVLAKVALAGGAVLLLLWGLWRLYHAFLWKVGRRLAFSYFLIGVLPIPLVMMLLAAVAYIQAGYVLGHLYRDAVRGVEAELEEAVRVRLERAATGGGESAVATGEDAPVAFALYRGGRRVAGSEGLPEAWPAWLAAAEEVQTDDMPAFFALAGARPTLAAAAGDATLGVAAVYAGDLAQELTERSGVWVRLGPAGEEEAQGRVDVEIMGRAMAFKTDPRRSPGAAEAYFAGRAPEEGGEGPFDRWWDDPFLWWGEVPGPLRALADGSRVADNFGVALTAPPRTLERLFVTSAELDVSVWSALFVFAFLLFDVYAAAALMAAVMIFALSRAVDRLSGATDAVRRGDFSVRIPVRRKDQVGELQRSFNTMAANLEELVATATQKELLEKELAIARDLQQSLVPHDLPHGRGIELASLFEPSAAIGGDYFDVLRLGDDRLAVVVADVSGHGLPTGLRMAMLKAALTILVSEERPVEEILRKLDAVVRLDDDGRFFVTATVALLDFRDGTLQITNAGHPPTYLVRSDGTLPPPAERVREIMLPGQPLGGIAQSWGKEQVQLRPDDVVVWLSDGLIEAVDGDDEPFGYHGVQATLERLAEAAAAGRTLSADEVRDGLVAAVERHTGGRPAEDDRTLVVMRYNSEATADSAMPSVE